MAFTAIRTRKNQERVVGNTPAVLSEDAQQFSRFSESVFRNMRPGSERPPAITDEQLASLVMPVLVLLGENDVTMDSQQIERRVRENVSGAQVLIVPGARHYLGDQSDPIPDFLQRTDDAGVAG